MKIGVSGASGQLASATIGYLKERIGAANIVGISRTPEKVSSLGVTARLGDFDKPESLSAAFAGLDKLLLIPSADLTPGVRAAQNVKAIDSAIAAGVRHLVFFSSAGTRKSAGIWSSYFPAEEAIRRAPSWTILRMAYYAESLIDEAKRSFGHGVLTGLADARVNFVGRDDLAAAAAGLLATEGHDGATYNGTGPRTYTGTERAAAISEAAGKPLGFLTLPREHLQAGLGQAGLPPHIVDAVLGIQEAFASGGFDLVTGDIERLSGRAPTSLEQLLQRAFQ
jgi:NAD(P)H dehydrogenase (quinone)